MYNLAMFKDKPYFKNVNPETLLDPLTNVLNRRVILGYAQYLIDNEIPFAFQILDLDNFKLINDNYGHRVGDEVLCALTSGLVKYLKNDGYVGRFGGDEFIIIYLKGVDYESSYEFARGLYGEQNVIRRTVKLTDTSPFITATIGSASFPCDAKDYDTLFSYADKALYRGKQKGRNCFIVYVDSKHRNLDTSKRTRLDIADVFINLTRKFQNLYQDSDKLRNAICLYLYNVLHLYDFVIFDNEMNTIASCNSGYTFDSRDKEFIESNLDENNFFSLHDGKRINRKENSFMAKCAGYNIRSFMIHKVNVLDEHFGYIACFENKLERMWQVEEIALMIYIANLLTVNKYFDK